VLVQVIRALLENAHMQLEAYLHQLIPVVLTCLLAKVGEGPWLPRASLCVCFSRRLNVPQKRMILIFFVKITFFMICF
jgi:hypothetical protein